MVDKLFEAVEEKLKMSQNDDFTKLETNFDAFNYVWRNEFVIKQIDKLMSKNDFNKKDLEKAAKYREEGNIHYKKNYINDAIYKYNLSLKYSPLGSENLALSYANRSVMFFHKRIYQLCINDINEALANGYPAKLQPKLYERKAECFSNMGNFKDGSQFLEDALKSPLCNEDPKLKQSLEGKLKVFKDSLASQFIDSDDDNLDDIVIAKPALAKNEVLVSADAGVQLCTNKDRGNHLRAARTIEVGEMLVKETPYACVLLNSFTRTNCYECMLRLSSATMNISYCEHCSLVGFCSPECKKNAWAKHHAYECTYLNLISDKAAISHMEHLSLRIVLKAGFERLKELKSSLVEFEKSCGGKNEAVVIEKDAPYESASYLNIFRLMTHWSRREPADLLRRALVSALLLRTLVKSDFFGANRSEVDLMSDEEVAFIGGLMLRHNQSISCNAHEISELEFNRKSLTDSVTRGIGAGIYAVLSLFNHSCEPHVTRNFDGPVCTVRAIRTIERGEEIFDNYGVHYAVQEIGERRAKLYDQYFFNCECVACCNDWPLYDKITNDLTTVKYKCRDCKKIIKANSIDEIKAECCKKSFQNSKFEKSSLEKAKTQYKESFQAIMDSKFSFNLNGHAQAFVNYLKMLDAFVATRPFQEYNNCQEVLKQIFNLMSSNKCEM